MLIVGHVTADDAAGREPVGRFPGMSLPVGDPDRTCAERRDRGIAFDGPRRSWGGTLAFFREPDGNPLRLDG